MTTDGIYVVTSENFPTAKNYQYLEFQNYKRKV